MALGVANIMKGYASAILRQTGGDITYSPSGGVAKTIKGKFDSPFEQSEIEETTYQSKVYTLYVATDDVTGITTSDTFTIETVTYNIIGIEPGFTGITIVRLQV